ncbi:MAG: ribosome silencing factor [Fusobacteriales bacterium]|jgi:ribosome-associated protein|nr:ribosome silencing factor [Fusobacteriales bacterium]
MENSVKKAIEIIESKKGDNIKVYDVQGRSPFMDYIVVCDGSSSVNMEAIATELKKEIPAYKSMEGAGESQWILIDFGDFIVNIFNREKREYYNIDELYQSS